MQQYFTEQEAKKIGSPVTLLNDWGDLMQTLWTASISFFRMTKDNTKFFPKQHDNEIFIGGLYRISAHIVNNKYIEVDLRKGEQQVMVIRFRGNKSVIADAIFTVLNYE